VITLTLIGLGGPYTVARFRPQIGVDNVVDHCAVPFLGDSLTNHVHQQPIEFLQRLGVDVINRQTINDGEADAVIKLLADLFHQATAVG
jgi:hypothetical protein